MYKFYLMRHGETEFNRKRIVQGSCNSDLTKEGIEKAKEVSEFVKNLDFKYVYSGALTRQIETAKIVTSKKNDIVHIIDANLNEVHFGSFENKPIEDMFEASRIYAEKNGILISNPKTMCDNIAAIDVDHTCEDYETVVKRVDAAFNRIKKDLDSNNENSCLILSSGLYLQVWLYHFYPEISDLHIKNLTLYEFIIDDDNCYHLNQLDA